MEISFFEEFPVIRNLEKLKYLDFNTRLYVAANSYDKFQEIGKRVRRIKPSTSLIYWPVLNRKEGYWISPFSDKEALRRVLGEIPKGLEVMLDFELPLDRKMILRNILYYFQNKRLIRDFIASHNVVSCEVEIGNLILRILGLHYPNIETIKMAYTSFQKTSRKRKDEFLRKWAEKSRRIGLGCVGKGILGNEPVLSSEELERELKILKEYDVEEAVIFRLGGMSKEYFDVVNGVLGGGD